MMDNAPGEKPETHQVDRRAAGDRRNRQRQLRQRETAHVPIAKLVSVLLGLLIGFICANLITASFTEDFRSLKAQNQKSYDNTKQQLTEGFQAYQDDRETLRELQRSLEDLGLQLDEAAAPETPESRLDHGESETPSIAEVVSTDHEPTADVIPSGIDDTQPEEAGKQAPEPDSLEALLADYSQQADKVNRTRKTRNTYEQNLEFYAALIDDCTDNIRTVELSSIGVVLIMAFVGYLCHPLLIGPLRRLAGHWASVSSGPEPRTTQAVGGFFAGTLIAVVVILMVFNSFGGPDLLLANPLFKLIFGAAVILTLGWAGALVGVAYFGPPRHEEDPYQDFRSEAPPKLLDTSVVIDGRIPEVAAAGFLDGVLVITASVLRELQLMADSANDLKRSKGRRGLELLRKMQDDPRLHVKVLDDARFDRMAQGTDEQLILVAQAMAAEVVTNDYNLNRVAAIRDVRVININALANAVKTNHIPGDYMEIEVLSQGKQKGQGVGYLDDGTMVVVEDGEPYIHSTQTIKLTSVTQTAHGRMLFGRVDAAQADEEQHGQH